MELSMIGRAIDFGYKFWAHGGDNNFINNKALSCVITWSKWAFEIDAKGIEPTLDGIKTFCDLRKGCIAANDLIQMASMRQVPGVFGGVKLVGDLATGMKATDKLKVGSPWSETSRNVLGLISGGAGMIVAANKVGLFAIFGIASDVYTGKGQLDAKKVEVIFTTTLNIGIFIFKTGEFAKSFFALIVSIPQVSDFAENSKAQLEAYFSPRVKEWVTTGVTVSGLALSIKKEFYGK